MSLRCLVVSGDSGLRSWVEGHLGPAGHHVTLADDARGMLAAHTAERFDLVVLASLPDLGVSEACEKLRALPHTTTTYVLVADAPGAVTDIDALLAAGADECLDAAPTEASIGRRLRVVERRILGQIGGRVGAGDVDRRLVAADRMASMGVLAAGVAHELNNPLAFVAMGLRHLEQALDPLLREHAPDEEAELMGSVHAALEGCERMRVILSDLQTFARSARWERPGPVDVRNVLDAAVSIVYNEIRHRARLVRSYADVKPVKATEARIGQVFLNLLTNAVHAIPVGAASENEIRIAVRHADEQRISVEISDTGAGIAPEHLSRLFEPFFTTKGEAVGTGLGLPICQRIVQGIGGFIEVESELGHGTTFRIVLPTTFEEVAFEPARPASGSKLRGRLLLVDDEPHVAEAVGRLLTREAPELEVVIAVGGDRALALIADDPPFDLVITDLMMPQMSGMDLYARLSANDPRLAARTAFVTGGAFTERARRFVQEHSDRVLEKPFSMDQLLPLLQRLSRD